MKPPCDEVAIRAASSSLPCEGKSRKWVLVATILASSMAFIDSTVVNVALPAIQSNFHATLADVQWVVESYGLSLGALILGGGALGDMFGRRLVFMLGVVLFAVASLSCGLSSSIGQLIIARGAQGIGAALLVPGSLAIISTSFDSESRGKAIGTWSGFTAITTAIGPVLGGWLVEHASWRWAFFINLPLAVAVVSISLLQIPESRNPNANQLDWVGAVLASMGLAGLVNGFIESVSRGFGNPRAFGSLLIGTVSLAAFGLAERSSRSPMVPFSLFKSSSFSGANLLTLSLYAAIGIFFFLFPLNLIQIQGYSATASGAAMLPLILLMFLFSRWSGGLVARYGPQLPLMIGPLIVTFGFCLFVVPSVGGSYWTAFFPAIIVLGFGMAVTVAPLTTVVMTSVSQDRVGAASGINNAVARVAGVLSIAVFGIVMAKVFGSHLNNSLAQLSLPLGVLHELQANENRLAGLQIPAGLGSEDTTRVRESIEQAFVFGFRTIMLVCAVLAAMSSAIAWRMVPKHSPELLSSSGRRR